MQTLFPDAAIGNVKHNDFPAGKAAVLQLLWNDWRFNCPEHQRQYHHFRHDHRRWEVLKIPQNAKTLVAADGGSTSASQLVELLFRQVCLALATT